MPKAEWGLEIPGGYFSESDHVYRDEEGKRVISTTQAFTVLGMSDFSRVNPEVLAWKQNYGIAVHRCIELLAFDRLDWDTVDDVIVPPVTGVELWLKEVQFEPIAAEEVRINTIFGMKHGMRIDLRGTLIYKGARRHAVIDIKTGSEASPTWKWQVGGYVAGAPPLVGSLSYIGLALQVAKDGRVKPHFIQDLLTAKREFGTLLAAANLKVSAGMGV